ncbi:MAG: hypothetical protein QW486_00325 [Candidatus Bathyarchaeia archaeon]
MNSSSSNERKKWSGYNPSQVELTKALERFKERVGLGLELRLEWLPGKIRLKNGRRLEEEVIGDTILIYSESPERAEELVAHGLAEWLLNQHTRRYRVLINKLIEVFEEIQYRDKERIVEALANLIRGA